MENSEVKGKKTWNRIKTPETSDEETVEISSQHSSHGLYSPLKNLNSSSSKKRKRSQDSPMKKVQAEQVKTEDDSIFENSVEEHNERKKRNPGGTNVCSFEAEKKFLLKSIEKFKKPNEARLKKYPELFDVASTEINNWLDEKKVLHNYLVPLTVEKVEEFKNETILSCSSNSPLCTWDSVTEKFICEVCSKSFPQYRWERHIGQCFQMKLYFCPVLDCFDEYHRKHIRSSFGLDSNRQHHITKFHPNLTVEEKERLASDSPQLTELKEYLNKMKKEGMKVLNQFDTPGFKRQVKHISAHLKQVDSWMEEYDEGNELWRDYFDMENKGKKPTVTMVDQQFTFVKKTSEPYQILCVIPAVNVKTGDIQIQIVTRKIAFENIRSRAVTTRSRFAVHNTLLACSSHKAQYNKDGWKVLPKYAATVMHILKALDKKGDEVRINLLLKFTGRWLTRDSMHIDAASYSNAFWGPEKLTEFSEDFRHSFVEVITNFIDTIRPLVLNEFDIHA